MTDALDRDFVGRDVKRTRSSDRHAPLVDALFRSALDHANYQVAGPESLNQGSLLGAGAWKSCSIYQAHLTPLPAGGCDLPGANVLKLELFRS